MLTNVDDEDERRILLSDFGIARTVDDVSGLTTTNMTVGTVAYSAPEQLMGEDIDGRADQYSLAATAYHLLTGTPLFPHPNPAVVISRHLSTAPPALGNTRPELATLDPVLAAALSKNPDDRFARCRLRPGACRTDAEYRRADTSGADHTGACEPIRGFPKRTAGSRYAETSGDAGPWQPPFGAGRRSGDRGRPDCCRRVDVAAMGAAPQRIRHPKSAAYCTLACARSRREPRTGGSVGGRSTRGSGEHDAAKSMADSDIRSGERS